MMDIAYRFAGFAEESCTCLTEFEPAAHQDGVQRLHLIADPRQLPTTMRLIAPDLVAGRLTWSGSMR
jgi:methoxymalonate biosynthesis protein